MRDACTSRMHLNLCYIFRMWFAKLEIDNMRLVSVRHHTVWTTFHEIAIVVQSQDAALVEQLPLWREPVGYSRRLQSFAQQTGNFFAREFVVVKDAFALQLTQNNVDVGSGTDAAEHLVEHATHLDVAEFTSFVVTLHKVATAIALTELDGGSKRLDADLI